MNAHNGGIEAQNGACRICMPVVAALYDFEEGQDPDPHQSEKADPQHRFLVLLSVYIIWTKHF